MSRYFMIQSWVGSHENEPDYNGQQCGERNVRSSEVVPLYDRHGNANTQYFSDEAIAERMGKTAKKSSVSIEDRILPQAKRVRVLTEQLIELEAERKAGMDLDKYSHLRDILICKRQRAEFLLKKAVSVKPIRQHTEQDEFQEETQEYSGEYGSQNVESGVDVPVWLSSVSDENSLKKIIVKGCVGWRKLVQFKSQAKAYIKTLSEV